MSKEAKNQKKHKISRILRLSLFIISIVLFLCIIINTTKLRTTGENLLQLTQEYQNIIFDAYNFNAASEYLTSEAHYFVTFGDIKNLYNYFQERNVTRRRDHTISRLHASKNFDNAQIIDEMMEISKLLEEKEIYSFKLFSQIFEIDPNLLPKEIVELEISKEDENLPRNEKYEKARDLIFNQFYQQKKIELRQYLSEFTTVSSNNIQEKRLLHANAVKLMNIHQTIFTISLFSVLLVFFITSLVLHSEKTLLLKKNRTDSLTGVQNRAAFDKAVIDYTNSMKPIAYVMIDVDHFKAINDTYGHDVGDKILKLITSTISNHFRDADVIFRVGGDEFVMLLDNWDEGSKSVLLTKFEIINRELKECEEGIPPTSISVGIAFSSMGITEKLQKHADKALYTAKASGRGCAKVFESGII